MAHVGFAQLESGPAIEQTEIIEEIKFGIRYEPLKFLGGDLTNIEESIPQKHWVLVFTGAIVGFRIEAGSDENSEIPMTVHPCGPLYEAHPVGIFRGKWSDLRNIMEVHPQRRTMYSKGYNNCQHFVANYLVFLEALANSLPGRTFEINNKERYDTIGKTLKREGRQIWHEHNGVMVALSNAPVHAAGVATWGAALVATETTVATVTSTVSAGGIAGWFGATTTVASSIIVPTAGATIAAACVPIGLACAAGTGLALYLRGKDWRSRTTYDNPLITGYRTGYYPALGSPNRSASLGNVERFVSLDSVMMASVSSAASVAEYTGYWDPVLHDACGASSMLELAGKLLV